MAVTSYIFNLLTNTVYNAYSQKMFRIGITIVVYIITGYINIFNSINIIFTLFYFLQFMLNKVQQSII